MSNICIFEDEKFVNFLPLVYTRPVYDLVCGYTTLRHKISNSFPQAKISLHCRSYLAPVLKSFLPKVPINRLAGENYLFINGRILPEKGFSLLLSKNAGKETVFLKDKEVVAIRLGAEKLKEAKSIFKKEPMKLSFKLKQFSHDMPKIRLNQEVSLVSYPWEIVNQNETWLKKDALKSAKLGKCLTEIPDGVHLLNKGNTFVNRRVKISPGVVVDAQTGPVIIEEGAKIFPQVTIIGPAYIGKGSILKIGAKIYPGTTIGKVCKVGGEVEESIICDFSNKQHDGFIGHSYLGSWINLGSGTTNSDLKNNYGPVKAFIDGQFINTGLTFVGLFMGDHSKSGINTIFNTGTVVGVSCNLFGSNFHPKFVPSFSWGEKGDFSTYRLEKFFEVAQRVMARRGGKFSIREKNLFRKIFTLTKPERMKETFHGRL